MTPSLVENLTIANKYVQHGDVIDIDQPDESYTTTLKRFLSVNAVLSTASSFAIRQQQAAERDLPLEVIGEGFCGVIYDFPSRGLIIKAGRPNKKQEMWADHVAHIKMWEASKTTHSYAMPRPAYIVQIEDLQAWKIAHRKEIKSHSRFFFDPSAIMVSERILPLPRSIREALVSIFCPSDMKAHASNNPANKHCVIRVYLGRRCLNQRVEDEFSLRNFELTLDKMEILGVNPQQYVQPMAEALAVMHWSAQIDGADVEFVLGSSPERRISAQTLDSIDLEGEIITTWNLDESKSSGINFLRRSVSIFLLDFNQCRRLPPTPRGIENAVTAFWENDPYYPKPGYKEGTPEWILWDQFKSFYLAKSYKILDDSATMPAEFLRGVEEHGAAGARQLFMGGPPPQTLLRLPRNSSLVLQDPCRLHLPP
ncbi:zinc finger protein-domain-containing protein [Colletotrichum godetiae]|uniref:Zinc finger protein-domain-containing protein n=1 Tax=Colletotrichum godetiae TaxID=1209918 RepID=A0AAJ0EPS9_9PEZI|nr:zinc finger protein-domain-containing protein [Colletotrichum godetiae]KAK1656914.1 zinc finger protein-domain-containing protein [Colletotrichum godetiae]